MKLKTIVFPDGVIQKYFSLWLSEEESPDINRVVLM